MTILIDDAGSGDLLFGTVIGGYRLEDDHFIYDLINVEHFQMPLYKEKTHLDEAKHIALELIKRLGLREKEKIIVCNGDILNIAAEALFEQYGEDIIERGKIEGKCQKFVELAYANELRNIGYEPIDKRTEKWGKNFWDMYNWLKADRSRLKFAKSAFPNLKKYPLFK
ncbi:hypothetical protein ACFL0D_02385 [Thermoproteota archaeon]